ncbi:CotH kinase family protein [Ruminococcus sp.]|uniref:CotH kinase family protein n=1 Tax=Ruminococcus sp. TaxID=41978 RepID=UPI0025E85307|nr:CotH kinase family protein [Ruminococcus sp.]
MNSIIYKDLKSTKLKKLFAGFISAILIVALCISCADNKIPKEHAGIDAEYEDVLFEKGKLNDIKINMGGWNAFVQKTFETPVTSSAEEQLHPKEYDSCNVVINGEEIKNTGIRTKGVYSLQTAVNSGSDRFSLVLKFNAFDKQKYHELRMIDLNSNIMDATSMKDAITYDMCRYIGLPAPLCNYAKITVNGKYYGCYLAVEPVGKDFCKRNYGEDYGSLYKPLHNLNYTGIWSKKYKSIKDMVKIERSPFSNVKAALKSVHKKQDIESHVDVDAVLKYMAVHTMVVNLDGLTGDITHNFYLYESDGRISLIPWDYDLAFGGMMLYNGKMFNQRMKDIEKGTFNKDQWLQEKENAYHDEIKQIINLPIDTPFTCDLSEREFFMNILNIDEYRNKYHDYLSVLAEQYVLGGELEKTINTYTAEIQEIVGTEENAHYKNADFTVAVEQLKLFLQRKSESVIGQLNDTIPSDWNGQKDSSDKLIDTSDLDLRLMGEEWGRNKK